MLRAAHVIGLGDDLLASGSLHVDALGYLLGSILGSAALLCGCCSNFVARFSSSAATAASRVAIFGGIARAISRSVAARSRRNAASCSVGRPTIGRWAPQSCSRPSLSLVLGGSAAFTSERERRSLGRQRAGSPSGLAGGRGRLPAKVQMDFLLERSGCGLFPTPVDRSVHQRPRCRASFRSHRRTCIDTVPSGASP
jgi:hypothetical protein